MIRWLAVQTGVLIIKFTGNHHSRSSSLARVNCLISYPKNHISPFTDSHLKELLRLIKYFGRFQPKLGGERCVQYFLMPETGFKLKVGMMGHTRLYNTELG